MAAIADKRLNLVKSFIKTLPRASLRSLELALGLTHDAALVEVRELISLEIEFRYVREAIFEPFMPLFQAREDGLEGVRFAPWILDRLWAALENREPELYKQSRYALRGLRTEDPTPVVFFRMVSAGALICREYPEEVMRPGASQGDSDEVAEFANYLDLHRLLRVVIHKLPGFMSRIDAEKAAALRLMFRDACAIHAEGGYRFLEALFANLDDGSQIVKFVVTVSDRAGDRFLAQSELANFGERILDHIEAQLRDLKRFMGSRHKLCEDLGLAGQRITQSLSQLQSFEHYVELSRDGPWGKRIADAHRMIAEMVEGQLRGVERLLEDVLPIRSERVYGRVKKEVPRLDLPADDVIQRARQALAFMRSVRNTAVTGGFAALHNRTVQALETMLDTYFEELLAIANGPEPFDPETVMTFFELVTDQMEALCGEDKAHQARRRVASSDLMKPRDVA